MSSVKKISKGKGKAKIEKKPSEASTVSSIELQCLKSPPPVDTYDTVDENDSFFPKKGNMEAGDDDMDFMMDPSFPKYLEALEKELDRKIEQAPAAKVIISDAMMREALSEIESSRRSSRSIVNRVTAQVPASDGAGGDGDASNVARSTQQQETEPDIAGAAAIEDDSNGCSLDKILEFLQAVMIKDYKRALVLAKEVEQLEPNNELIQEYMVVLKKIVRKEREDEEQESDSDTESSGIEGVVYSDELTTSTETESMSGEESEHSKVSRSTTYYPSSGEEEEDVVEEVAEEEKVMSTVNVSQSHNANDDSQEDSLLQAKSLQTEVATKDASDSEKNDAYPISSLTTTIDRSSSNSISMEADVSNASVSIITKKKPGQEKKKFPLKKKIFKN